MNPASLALLVVVWSGHDLHPQAIGTTECDQAVNAINMAIDIRNKQYAMQSDVSAYCIQLNTAADSAVYALLAPPEPSPASKPVRVEKPIH